MRWDDENIKNPAFDDLKKRSNAELEAIGFAQMNMSARGILSNRLGGAEYEKRCRAWGLWGAEDFKTVGVRPGSQEAFDRYITKRDELSYRVPRDDELSYRVPRDDEPVTRLERFSSMVGLRTKDRVKEQSQKTLLDLVRQKPNPQDKLDLDLKPGKPKANPYLTATQDRFKGLFDE